jgi:hypothetical protein
MKLTKVEISGFRGSLPILPLQLDKKSICIFGENGYGKSTIADSLELWSTGDIGAFHRAGCKLDAAIHVYATEATITVQTDGAAGPIRRGLKGQQASDPEVVDQVADTSKAAGLPLLRHETVSDFMRKSAGEKKDELLQLIGLEPLSGFREALRKSKTEAKRSTEGAAKTLDTERTLLFEKCGGKDTVAFAEELRTIAKLMTPITSLDDLRATEVTAGSDKASPNRLGGIDALERSLSQVSSEEPNDWNALVADKEAVTNQAIAALLREGQQVLPLWSEDSCPLCLSTYSRESLSSELAHRVGELGEIEKRFADARQRLLAITRLWEELGRSIATVIRVTPSGDWPNQATLEAAQKSVDEHALQLTTAAQGPTAAPDAPTLPLAEDLQQMRAAAASEASPEQAAQIQLGLLRAQLQRVDDAEAKRNGATSDLESVDALLGIADAQIEAAINAAIKEIGELVASYYLKISGSSVYSDVELVYDSKYAGGAEFSIVYDKTKTFTPPQRVMSNGQLNALALAFFLAKTKLSDGHWRTIVLDDVISSFGGVHRRGLLDLLGSEFSDWQVLLLTHDKTFALLAREALGSGWEHTHISQWTPSGGPVLVDGDPLGRLQALLDSGAGASDLGGIGREAFEQTLAVPLEKLGYPIPYRANGRYTGMEYLIALRKGLKGAKSPLAAAPVLAKLEADNFVLNLAAHHQPNLSGAETADFQQLAQDLRDVRELFKCSSCNEQVWTMEKASSSHTCRCKQLAA